KYPGGSEEDYVYYLPTWEPGTSIDLGKEFAGSERVPFVNPDSNTNAPEGNKKLQGRLRKEWEDYWVRKVKSSAGLGEGFGGDSRLANVRNDQNRQPHQALWHVGRAVEPKPRDQRRRLLWLHRAERCGQDHDHQNPCHAASADLG